MGQPNFTALHRSTPFIPLSHRAAVTFFEQPSQQGCTQHLTLAHRTALRLHSNVTQRGNQPNIEPLAPPPPLPDVREYMGMLGESTSLPAQPPSVSS